MTELTMSDVSFESHDLDIGTQLGVLRLLLDETEDAAENEPIAIGEGTRANEWHLELGSVAQTVQDELRAVLTIAERLAIGAARIPEAQVVVADLTGSEPVIRTYITRRDTAVRSQIYDLEDAIWQDFPDTVADFQVASLDSDGCTVPEHDPPRVHVWPVRGLSLSA